jgi:hypothetical protein
MMITAIPKAMGEPAQRVTALAKVSNALATGFGDANAGLDVSGTVSSGSDVPDGLLLSCIGISRSPFCGRLQRAYPIGECGTVCFERVDVSGMPLP